MIQDTLTDIKRTKICYIEDINKAQVYLTSKTLSTEQFEFLYDQNLEWLEELLSSLELTIVKVNELTLELNSEKR